MESNNSRNPEDLEIAHYLGHKLGLFLEDVHSYWHLSELTDEEKHLREARQEPVNAGLILRELLKVVDDFSRNEPNLKFEYERHHAPPLAKSVIHEFTRDIDDAIRIILFSRQYELEGVPVFSQDEVRNDFGSHPFFDVFNGRARQCLTDWEFGLDAEQMGEILRTHPNEFSNRSVLLLPLRQACAEFMTLFSDSLRSAIRMFRNQNVSYVRYSVSSTNSGYQLEYWPQYNYTPIVFGNGLTTPLDHTVKIGHYHFQGWRNGKVTRDGGVYFASPQNSSAHLRDF